MSKIRTMLGAVVFALLALGYMASQYTALYGDAADYARRVDIPQVKLLSLVLFIAALVFAFIPDKEEVNT